MSKIIWKRGLKPAESLRSYINGCEDWQVDFEGCAFSDTGTFRMDGAAVQFNNVVDNGQPEAEAAVLSRQGTVALSKSIEHMR